MPPAVDTTIDVSGLLRRQSGNEIALDASGLHSVNELVANPAIAPMLGLVARSIASALGFLELTHIRVLVVLSQRDEMSVAELVALMKMRARVMLKILDAMDNAGWIVTAKPGRGTSEMIAISAQGRQLVDDVTAQRQREIDMILDRMTNDDREVLARAFNSFAAAAGERPVPKPKSGIAPASA